MMTFAASPGGERPAVQVSGSQKDVQRGLWISRTTAKPNLLALIGEYKDTQKPFSFPQTMKQKVERFHFQTSPEFGGAAVG